VTQTACKRHRPRGFPALAGGRHRS
jgi:hypothetical protein